MKRRSRTFAEQNFSHEEILASAHTLTRAVVALTVALRALRDGGITDGEIDDLIRALRELNARGISLPSFTALVTTDLQAKEGEARTWLQAVKEIDRERGTRTRRRRSQSEMQKQDALRKRNKRAENATNKFVAALGIEARAYVRRMWALIYVVAEHRRSLS